MYRLAQDTMPCRANLRMILMVEAALGLEQIVLHMMNLLVEVIQDQDAHRTTQIALPSTTIIAVVQVSLDALHLLQQIALLMTERINQLVRQIVVVTGME